MRVDLTIIPFVCVALVLIPLPIFWKARNWTMVGLIAWMVAVNMIRGINTIAWADNVEVKYVVWCDITTKLYVGSCVAVPALLVCLCRSLALIASGENTSTTVNKRQRGMLEVLAGVVLPIIYMALHYVVQGHRFDIIEDFGCIYVTYVSFPSLFLVSLPPILLSFATLIYSGMALVYFVRRRRDIFVRGQRSQSGLTPATYVRLIALSVLLMLSTQTITLWYLIATLEDSELQPWISWEHVHADWSRIWQIPRAALSQTVARNLLISSHFPSICSLLFFAFFGCSRTVWAECIMAYRWMRGRVSRAQSQSPVLPLSSNSNVDLAGSTVAVPPPAKLKYETPSVGERDFADPAQLICIPSPSCELVCAGSSTRVGL